MIEIKPTTRKVWWNPELKKKWESRINRISTMYHEAEFITVMLDMRDLYIYHVRSTEFEGSYDFLRNNELIFYPTNKSGIYSGFSHKHRPVEPGKPFTLYGGVVKQGKTDIGEEFIEANNNSDHDTIGKLLGYPKCCTDFFKDNWGITRSVDPIYEAAVNTTGNIVDDDKIVTVECHPYCNNMLRYYGIRITPHLTHSFQCEETIKWGEQWMEVLKEIDEEASEWVVELLSMPMTWNCYKGVAIIDTPIFRGVTNSDMTMEYKIVNSLGWNK